MPCTGTLGQHLVLHPGPKHSDDSILLYNNVEAHVSHTMATAGAARSKHLKLACTHRATNQAKKPLGALGEARSPTAQQRSTTGCLGISGLRCRLRKVVLGGCLGLWPWLPLLSPLPCLLLAPLPLMLLHCFPSPMSGIGRLEALRVIRPKLGGNPNFGGTSKSAALLGLGPLGALLALPPRDLFQAWGWGGLEDFGALRRMHCHCPWKCV